MHTYHLYEHGVLKRHEGKTVEEFPLVLHVNGREIATLISSPHELRYLVAGFLRLQGFVSAIDDFHLLSVCDDYGIANVRIKKELPERLRPVLTSGCGTGITFTLPGEPATDRTPVSSGPPVAPAAVFRLMEELAKRADNYRTHGRTHGGIHSAAVGEYDGSLLLSSEDIGRHNTLDRIAGESLLKGIDLQGRLLVTSGRISSEMAAKAAHLGISVLASRTSPTDKAVAICAAAGITLIGYVRAERFSVYTHHELLKV
jgi:FdhD protein